MAWAKCKKSLIVVRIIAGDAIPGGDVLQFGEDLVHDDVIYKGGVLGVLFLLDGNFCCQYTLTIPGKK